VAMEPPHMTQLG